MKNYFKCITHFVAACTVLLISINLSHSKQYTLEDTQKWLKQWGKHYTLEQLKTIKKLDLSGTSYNISSLKNIQPISTLTSLEQLHLKFTKVSDLIPLKYLRNLKKIYLINTQVSDVNPLSGLTSLQTLDLRYTKVSKEQVEELKKAIPNCYIAFYQ